MMRRKNKPEKIMTQARDYKSGKNVYIPDDVVFVKTAENEKKINMYSIIYVFRMLQSQPVPDTYLTALDRILKIVIRWIWHSWHSVPLKLPEV